MPATTHSKTETKVSTDLGDAAKQCLNGLEKKVRNLEKRKARIEQNQEKARKGIKLEKEQEDSLQQYDQVMHCLEFARELHKQFLQINQEHEKVARKQAKREKAERQALEIKRICEILQLQALLDLLGRDNVREDFKTGKHGAVVLTEDNLNQLDELYQAISPSRDDSGDEYPQRITLAAEHLVNYLDAKDRQVVGTTYKELKELITIIAQCGYFEKPKNEEVLEAAAPEFATETDVAAADNEVAASEELASSNEPDQTLDEQLQSQQQPPIDLTTSVADVSQSHRVLPAPALDTLEQDAFFAPSSLPYQTSADPHFTQSSHAATSQIPDYPSFSNGPFQFIQASYVMPEAAGIVDPAVIVAQPAVNSGLQFMSQRYDSQPPQMQHLPPQPHLQQQNQTVNSLGELSQIQSSGSQQSQQLAQDYSSQNYAQNLQSDGLYTVQGVGEVGEKLSSHPSLLAQRREDGAASAFEIPPSIPLPPSQVQSESSSEQQQLQETQFQMNARAPVFQSMYSQMASGTVVVSQASGLGGSEGQISSSAVDFSKSSPTGEFGQPGAGDFQQNSKGGSYQSYAPSNSYRADSFHGGPYNYNKSRFSGEVHQKRGGPLGGPGARGYPRGGAGVNNGRGGMRGGMARGSNGSRGGYNRPLVTQ